MEDEEDMIPPDLGLMGLDISKIKIGRVEFKVVEPNEPENNE